MDSETTISAKVVCLGVTPGSELWAEAEFWSGILGSNTKHISKLYKLGAQKPQSWSICHWWKAASVSTDPAALPTSSTLDRKMLAKLSGRLHVLLYECQGTWVDTKTICYTRQFTGAMHWAHKSHNSMWGLSADREPWCTSVSPCTRQKATHLPHTSDSENPIQYGIAVRGSIFSPRNWKGNRNTHLFCLGNSWDIEDCLYRREL